MRCQGFWKLCFFYLSALCATGLFGQSQVWTSTSGSTIEAEYLGRFDEELWFVANDDKRLLKMPEKYISAANLESITAGVVQPIIPDAMVDTTPESITLFEALWTTPAPILQDREINLNEWIDAMTAPLLIDRPVDAPALVKFHRRNDKRIKLNQPTVTEGSLYSVIASTLEDLERTFQIKQGSLIIVRP